MLPTKYEDLLRLVAPRITRDSSKRADCIEPSERLSVTLRYLCTGDSFATISASFRISISSISTIVYETCEALWIVLNKNGYIEPPTSEEEWRKIAIEYEDKWNFPHCIGAIDGKHVVMQAPARSGSSFYNYKKCHSIVLRW